MAWKTGNKAIGVMPGTSKGHDSAIKVYGGMEVRTYSSLTSVLEQLRAPGILLSGNYPLSEQEADLNP